MKKDIVIIGGGPSGLAFACSLANSGLEVAIIEKSAIDQLQNPPYDGREIALTHPSVNFLKNFGAWDLINNDEISEIKEAKVLDGSSDYSLDFDNKNSNDPLGYLVSNNLIRKALYEQVSKIDNIEIIANKSVKDIDIKDDQNAMVRLCDDKIIEASLIVAADSRFSGSRRQMGIAANMRDFAKVMIVCKMQHQNQHHNIAYEYFDYDRVLAILPMSGNNSSVVITVDANSADQLLNMSEEEFSDHISQRFYDILGDMKLAGKRHSYPLIGVYSNKFVNNRFALIGDAAVGMHPVTAHGFNLGLIGQDILAKEIKSALNIGQDIGSLEILKKYQKQHIKATKPLYLGTNAVVGLFTDNRFLAKIVRKLALRIANNKIFPFKKMIINKLTGERRLGVLN